MRKKERWSIVIDVNRNQEKQEWMKEKEKQTTTMTVRTWKGIKEDQRDDQYCM